MAEGQVIELKTEESANPPNIGQVTAIQRPDWVAEKFYDSKTGVINFEAIARSHAELERKQSAAPSPAKPVEGQADESGKNEGVTPEPQKDVVVHSVPGVTPEALKEYSAELTSKGALSEKSYGDLLKAGYNKEMVDAYVRGLTADASISQAVSAARVADEKIAEITDSIGGKATLKEMQTWAKASLSDEDLKAYNAAVSGSDAAKVKLAVHGLHAQFVKANGTGENLLSGDNNVRDVMDVFHSRAEQNVAINDPRYQKDPAYRAAVAAKIGRSSL